MSETADNFAAAFPEPWRILGLRLRPFTLAHYQLLRSKGCAFLSDTESMASRPDLVLGVLACSMKPSEFVEFSQSKEFGKELKRWGRQLGDFDFKEKAELFAGYLKAHFVSPKYWVEDAGGDISAHWSQTLEIALRSKLHWTTQDLETFPLSKAFWDVAVLSEQEGSIRLLRPHEIEFLAEQEKSNGGK